MKRTTFSRIFGFILIGLSLVADLLGDTGTANGTAGGAQVSFSFDVPPPPSEPTGFFIAGVAGNLAALQWDGSQPGGSRTIDHYEIVLNGAIIAQTADVSFGAVFDPSLLAFFSVVAVDDHGARSDPTDLLFANPPLGPPPIPPAPSIHLELKSASVLRDKFGLEGRMSFRANHQQDPIKWYLSSDYVRSRLLDQDPNIHYDSQLLVHEEYSRITGALVSTVSGSIHATNYPFQGESATATWVLGENNFRAAATMDPPGDAEPDILLPSTGEMLPFDNSRTDTHELASSDVTFPASFFAGAGHSVSLDELTLSNEYTDDMLRSDAGGDFADAVRQLGDLDWGASIGKGVYFGNYITQAVGFPAERYEDHTGENLNLIHLYGCIYRLRADGATSMVHFRWQEVFHSADGLTTRVQNPGAADIEPDENGTAITGPIRLDPPDDQGQVEIVILPYVAEGGTATADLVTPSFTPTPGQPQLYVPNEIVAGQGARVDVQSNAAVTSATVAVTGPGGIVRLVVVDPVEEAIDGQAAAIADGQTVFSGADLTQLNGELLIVGQSAGSVTVHVTMTVGGQTTTQDIALTVSPPLPEIAVDANRDGQIKFPSEDGSDQTSATAAYRFWLNDDDDRLVDSSTQLYPELEEDDRDVKVTGAPNWRDDTISCMRDLEDFSRLWINLKGMTDAVRNGQLYVGLRWVNPTGDPGIKLYPHVEPDGGTKYLFDPAPGGFPLAQYTTTNAIPNLRYGTTINNTLVASVSGTFVFSTSVFSNLTESSPVAHLLFEGCSVGTGELKVVLLQKNDSDYTEIAQGGSVCFDLKEPKDFIERWSCGDGHLGAVQPVVRVNSKSVSPAWGKPVADEEKDYVLYVHGYNMQEFEKQRWVETTYKRLWHLGYKGRVGSFTWPCSQSGFPAPPYDPSEEKAWQSAAQLMALLSSLQTAGYHVHVLAHSQGNVVVGEALRQWKGPGQTDALVRTYVASQAAIQAHCYDPNAALIPGFTGSSTDNGTPNVYLSYPVTNGTYMSEASMSGTADTFRNFENADDYALTGNSPDQPTWQLNQRLKPDIGYGWTSTLGFYKGDGSSSSTQYFIPKDRFKVFAYGSEGRSLALGSTLTRGVFAGGDYNLKTQLGYGTEHIWHSAQFRSSLAKRYQYWIALLDAASIAHLNP